MRLCKKILRTTLLALIMLVLMSGTVLAAYSYYATVQVQETSGNSYSYLPIIAAVDNDHLADNGYISLTGLDTRVLSGSTELKHMVADDKTLFVAPSVGANSTGNYKYTLGNDLLSSFPIVVGRDGYITISNDADLEPGSNFEIEQKGYVDTSLSQVIVFVGAGAAAYAANGNVTPALPTGWVADDLFICIVASLDNVNSTLPAGWLAIDAGTNNGAGFRFTAYYKYAATGSTAPLVTHAAGSGISAVIVAYRGVALGMPVNVLGATSVNTPASTTLTFHATGITTTMNGCRVVELGSVAGQNVNTVNYTGAPTPTERVDAPNVAARPGVVVADFLQVTAGATGSRAATITSFLSNGILLALTPSSADLVRKDGAYKTYVSAPNSVTSTIGTDVQPIVGGFNDNLNPAATEYNCLMGGATWNATESNVYQVIPTGGTISGLLVKLSGNVAAASTYSFTLMVNSAPSALTVTIPAGAPTGSDWSNSVSVTAGQTVSLRSTFTGAPGALLASWSAIWQPSIAGESIMLVNLLSSVGGTVYGTTQGYTIGNGTESSVQAPLPTAGNFKKMYIVLSTDPGDPAGPDGYTLTPRINGANTTLTVTISADNTTGNDTTHTVAGAAGNLLSIGIVPLNVPAAAPYCAIGMVFASSTSGEYLVMGGTDMTQTVAGATRYIQLCGTGRGVFDAAEANAYSLTQSGILKKFYVKLNVAPDGGQSQTVSIREAVGNTGITVTISGAVDTTGNDVAHTYTSLVGDVADIMVVSSAGAAAAFVHWGVVYSNPLLSVVAAGVTPGVHTVQAIATGGGTNLFQIWVGDGDAAPTLRQSVALGTASVPNNGADWILAQNNVTPYMDYYKHTVSSNLIAWYQPVSMIIGTNLDDREGTDIGETGTGEEDGIITWGTNPAGVSATFGSLISSSQPSISPASEEAAPDIVPSGSVPVTGGVVNTTKLQDNPLYPVVQVVSEHTNYTEEQIWFFGATLIILIGMGLAAVKVPNHLLLAGTVGLVLSGFFTAMEIYQWWMILLFCFIFLMSLIMERKPVL